jgi:hypothetical protein
VKKACTRQPSEAKASMLQTVRKAVADAKIHRDNVDSSTMPRGGRIGEIKTVVQDLVAAPVLT